MRDPPRQRHISSHKFIRWWASPHASLLKWITASLGSVISVEKCMYCVRYVDSHDAGRSARAHARQGNYTETTIRPNIWRKHRVMRWRRTIKCVIESLRLPAHASCVAAERSLVISCVRLFLWLFSICLHPKICFLHNAQVLAVLISDK